MPTTTTDPTVAMPASTSPAVVFTPGPRRWKVALVLAAIFACGVLVGVLGTLRAMRSGARHRPDPARWTAMVMDRLDTRLHFTAAQRERITPLVRAGAEEAREARRRAFAETRGIIDRTHAQIAAELTDRQRQELERVIAERRSRARRWLGPGDGGNDAPLKRP